MSGDEEFLKAYLSPKSLAVLDEVRRLRAIGARVTEGIDAIKEEAFSDGDVVWACADGQGFIRALAIEDDAVSMYSAEELEDLISDCMIDACGRGQAAGELFLDSVAPQ